MKTGNIHVNTENIFPIIKKFLYSEHDIFLRELVCNAVDATQKYTTLCTLGEIKQSGDEPKITVCLNAKAKTITVSDEGIGMSADEIEKYINQLAFSGAEEFLQKYKDKTGTKIIGHFGLGFYSAFMVADKVEIFSQSARENTPAVHWTCDGSPQFTLEETTKPTRGTEIILHLNADSEEFLKAETIRQTLDRYCRFLAVPIFFDGKKINNTDPLWTKKPAELADKDYTDFYEELFAPARPPLFWIHLNVDYPFHLTGVLYFPEDVRASQDMKNKITLYVNRVYVTNNVEGILPDYLMWLHGLVDSPDIPLNVSRSALQGDPNIKKINQYISKKVIDKIEETFKQNREQFIKDWPSFEPLMKHGMLTDEKFFERLEKLYLFANLDKTYYTIGELREKLAAKQTDKHGNLILLYSQYPDVQDSYIRAAQQAGYEVLHLSAIQWETALLTFLETKWDKIRFKSVDADSVDNLIEKDEPAVESVLSQEEQERLKTLLSAQIDTGELAVRIDLRAQNPQHPLITSTKEEWNKRMTDTFYLSQNAANPPRALVFIVNTNHPLAKYILTETDTQKQTNTVRKLVHLALLSQGELRGKAFSTFIEESHNALLPS